MREKIVTFAEGLTVPAIGQGTWYMGENASQRRNEVDALRAGIDLGLTLIESVASLECQKMLSDSELPAFPSETLLPPLLSLLYRNNSLQRFR